MRPGASGDRRGWKGVLLRGGFCCGLQLGGFRCGWGERDGLDRGFAEERGVREAGGQERDRVEEKVGEGPSLGGQISFREARKGEREQRGRDPWEM